MSYPDNLSDKQFYKYKPAKEEGKPVSDWLASEGGHQWQDIRFEKPYGAGAPSGRNSGLYTIKHAQDEIGPAAVFPDDLPEEDREYWSSRRQAEVIGLNMARTRAEQTYNAPLRWEPIDNG